METVSPNYKKIYQDILKLKHPEKHKYCESILSKSKLSVRDIIRLNEIIFEDESQNLAQNQRFRAYDKSSISEILEYQKKNKLNNRQLANHFRLSRNTVANWKKIFLI